MIDKEDFEKIIAEMQQFDEKREETIRLSRDIIKLSKLIIYAVHRDDLKKAKELMDEISTKIRQLPKEHYDTGINKNAIQEYVECACLYHFVKDSRIPTRKELKVDAEDYLLGLCDLTGELVRKAVNHAINKQHDEVLNIRELVAEIYGQFLLLNLRNGELRKKSDSIKWNLNKLEDLALSISMK